MGTCAYIVNFTHCKINLHVPGGGHFTPHSKSCPEVNLGPTPGVDLEFGTPPNVFPLPLLSLPPGNLFLGCSLAGRLMDGKLSHEFDAMGGVWRLLSSLAVSIINVLIQSNIINRVNTFFLVSSKRKTAAVSVTTQRGLLILPVGLVPSPLLSCPLHPSGRMGWRWPWLSPVLG